MKTLAAVFALVVASALSAQTNQQLQPDPGLMTEINQIKAIDNHSHPPALDGPHGEKDDDFDALPCDPLEPTDSGLMFREDNPVYIKAWQTMFGYKYDDFKPEHVQELLAAKEQVKQREGDNYPNWVLDQLGIETELANRVAMGRGLQPPLFSLGGVRRHAAVSPEQLVAGGAVARSQDLLRPRGIAVRALPESVGDYRHAADFGAVHGQGGDASAGVCNARMGPWPSSLRLPICGRWISLPREKAPPPRSMLAT